MIVQNLDIYCNMLELVNENRIIQGICIKSYDGDDFKWILRSEKVYIENHYNKFIIIREENKVNKVVRLEDILQITYWDE